MLSGQIFYYNLTLEEFSRFVSLPPSSLHTTKVFFNLFGFMPQADARDNHMLMVAELVEIAEYPLTTVFSKPRTSFCSLDQQKRLLICF